jgi:hypothetical protein
VGGPPAARAQSELTAESLLTVRASTFGYGTSLDMAPVDA